MHAHLTAKPTCFPITQFVIMDVYDVSGDMFVSCIDLAIEFLVDRYVARVKLRVRRITSGQFSMARYPPIDDPR